MCERCTIIETAFGLKHPLPPRVASLDAETTSDTILTTPIPCAKADDDKFHPANPDLHLPVKDDSYRVPQAADNAPTQLCLPNGVIPVWQPPVSTLSEIRDSPLAPHRQRHLSHPISPRASRSTPSKHSKPSHAIQLIQLIQPENPQELQ